MARHQSYGAAPSERKGERLPILAAIAETWRRVAHNDQLLLFCLAVVVGTAAGYGALAFRLLTAAIQAVFLGDGHENVATIARALPGWWLLAAPTLGGLLIGLLTAFVLPGRQPQGVADVMEAAALKSGRMSLNEGLSAALVSAASIGCGASVGREGPIVHLGARLASTVARRLQLSAALAHTLLGCGVAAAIASAFNAPLAGVFFALEVVVGHYGLGVLAGRDQLGDRHRDHPDPHRPGRRLRPAAAAGGLVPRDPGLRALGLVSALAAIALLRAIALVDAAHDRLGTPRWLRPALAGLAVGLLALQLPEVLGVGYEATDLALRNSYELQLVILLALAKAAATALCLAGVGRAAPSVVPARSCGQRDPPCGAWLPDRIERYASGDGG